MKNDKFLVELLENLEHLSNRPVLFFLVWGLVVAFFLYLFWGLQKNKDKRYFKDDALDRNKTAKSIQIVQTEKKTELTKED